MNNTIEVTLNGQEGGEGGLFNTSERGEQALGTSEIATAAPAASIPPKAPPPPQSRPTRMTTFPSLITSET